MLNRPHLLIASSLVMSCAFGGLAQAEEPVDWVMVGKIREQGFEQSQVVQTLEHLADVIGPRLTGSPAMRQANEWTRDQMIEWGLENARLEPWGTFGLGWTFERVSVHLVSPRATPLFALPKAWTPGTAGPIRGLARHVRLESEQDLTDQRGRLKGAIVLLDEAEEASDGDRPAFRRYDDQQLDELEHFLIRDDAQIRQWRREEQQRYRFRKQLNGFLVEQGVVATFSASARDDGILRVGGAGSREPGESHGVPALVLAAEQYRWLARVLERGHEVEVEIDVSARFHDHDLTAYNTLAEIPGTDLSDQVVMLGAHLDSWHAAAGSNDNAAGAAVVMEAVRILTALGLEPRRTIRIALWSGEEQGLLGSRAYVRDHFASRPPPENPEQLELPASLWPETWPIEIKPEHPHLSAYFNLDNGSGRIRGIYTQGNLGVVPIFERWLEPLADLGAETVTNRDTGGTDHLAFDRVGLPGFQFIQDSLDYSSRTHHTHLDHLDHARAEDLMQAAVVVASFVYHAAMRKERLPRESMPSAPPQP